jgi:hypothetical protein
MQNLEYLGFRSPRIYKSKNSTPNSSTKGFTRKNSILKLEMYEN